MRLLPLLLAMLLPGLSGSGAGSPDDDGCTVEPAGAILWARVDAIGGPCTGAWLHGVGVYCLHLVWENGAGPVRVGGSNIGCDWYVYVIRP